MTKHRTFKKTKPGELKPVAARQLEGLQVKLARYDNFEHMELAESSFSSAYIPRALNNRDVNGAIAQMFFHWQMTHPQAFTLGWAGKYQSL